MRRYLIPLAVLTLAIFATNAKAEIVFAYSFEADPAPGPATGLPVVPRPSGPGPAGDLVINGDVGDFFRLNVYAVQTAGDTRLADIGLIQAGFVANFDNSLGQIREVIRASYLDDVAFQSVLRFSDNGQLAFDNAAGTVSIDGIKPPSAPAVGLGADNGVAFVGFFDYEIQAEGRNIFTLSDPNTAASFANVVLNDDPAFTVLDSTIFANSGVINIGTVAAIPEPSSLAFLAGIGAFCAVRRRRR